MTKDEPKRPRGWFLYVVLTAAVACAPSGPPMTIDLTRDFLARVCTAPPGAPFAQAWLEHERRHWNVYGAVYDAAMDERTLAATQKEDRQDDLCRQTRLFATGAPALLDTLRPAVARLIGATPRHDVLLAVPIVGKDGGMMELDGHPVIALNAGAETYARLDRTVVTLAHELVHDAQKTRWSAELSRMSSMAASLYLEGGAVFAMTILYPEVGERATGLPAEAVLAIARPRAAADLLERLDGTDDGRWFAGGKNKLGYVLGLDVYRELARRHGIDAALRLLPTEVVREARSILEDMARQPPVASARGELDGSMTGGEQRRAADDSQVGHR